VLLAEFLMGHAPAPGLTVHHTWASPPLLGHAGSVATQSALSPPPRLIELPAPEPLTRELADAEVKSLLAAGEDARLVCVAMLMGLTADELVALQWDAVELGGNIIRIPGNSAREFALEEPLRGLIVARQNASTGTTGTLLHAPDGAPMSVPEVARLVLYAAYDAGLERPHEVTPAVLRHTYLAFLLRQGIRLSDLGRIAGHIPQAELVGYMQLADSSARLPIAKIERTLPALRGLANA
jgi:polysaccharide biosynthesis transport protein